MGPDSLRVAWDSGDPNWVLEGSGDLFQFNTVLTAPSLVGGDIALTVPRDESAFFWRLRSQQTSGVVGGRGFLRDSQGDFGNWSGDGSGALLISSSALETLLFTDREEPDDAAAVALGIDVLGSAPTRNNDELSRKIIALAAGGFPTDSFLDDLVATQNDEAGWGAAAGYGDTLLDTALALRAVKEAGLPTGLIVVGEEVPAGQTSSGQSFQVPAGATGMFLRIHDTTGAARFTMTKPDSTASFIDDVTPAGVPISVPFGTPQPGTWTLTVTNNAGADLTYTAEVHFTSAAGSSNFPFTSAVRELALGHNPDGGWPIFAGGESHLLSTFEVMTTLRQYGRGFDEPLADAANWLYNNLRNGDGGYSSEPDNSNTLETALAVLALRASGTGLDLSAALSWLASMQLLNGSWGNDPYLTAMATRALYDPPPPPEPPVVTPIPDQTVEDPDPFMIIMLDDFVDDPDTPDEDIVWSVTGETQLTVGIAERIAVITYPAGTALSETLTFTATDPDGLSDQTAATFEITVTPLYDYSIARGSSVTDDSRTFTTTPENFNNLASYFYSAGGLPADVTYVTDQMLIFAPDTLRPTFTIAVGPTAPLGIHTFEVEYGIRDATSAILTPVFGNIFEFTIEITP